MDKERKKRLQTIRLVITEILMVIAVIVTVIILTFLAMGYNVDKDGKFNQFGLAQIKSTPSGATVYIDGEPLLLHTNTSRMLDAGTHHIKLEKDRYDTWEKDIVSESGVLLKLDYPRLFLKNRTPETVRDLKATPTILSFSDNRDYILYYLNAPLTATTSSASTAANRSLNDTNPAARSSWTLLDIRGDEVVETTLDFSEIIGNRTVNDLIWNKNNDHLLAKTSVNNHTEWLLLDLKNPENSTNLTIEYSLNFSDVIFGSGDRLLAIENGNLHTISVSEQTISGVLARNLATLAYRDPDIIFLTNSGELYYYQDDSEDILLQTFDQADDVKIAISTYLGKHHLGIIDGNRLSVYVGNFPSENNKLSEMELVKATDLTFTPSSFISWADDELFVATNENHFAVYDAELDNLTEFQTETSDNFFLDNYLLGTISDNQLIVRDFDGTNRRALTTASGPAIIARNNRFLYYQNSQTITREKILD